MLGSPHLTDDLPRSDAERLRHKRLLLTQEGQLTLAMANAAGRACGFCAHFTLTSKGRVGNVGKCAKAVARVGKEVPRITRHAVACSQFSLRDVMPELTGSRDGRDADRRFAGRFVDFRSGAGSADDESQLNSQAHQSGGPAFVGGGSLVDRYPQTGPASAGVEDEEQPGFFGPEM